MLIGYHWGQWTFFGILLTAVIVFVFCMLVIDPRKQRERLNREKSYFQAFTREMKNDHFRFADDSYYWQRLTPHYRREAVSQMRELLSDALMEPYELREAIAHLRNSPLSEVIEAEFIQPVARACIERTPNNVFCYELSREAWGSGNIPTDILLKLLHSNIDKDVILQKEIRPEDKAEIAAYIAKRGEWEYLEDLFGEGNFPEEYVRMALEYHLQEEEKKRSNDDILSCYMLLNEWDKLLGFAEGNKVPSEEVLDYLEEAPKEARDRFGTSLAKDGCFWNLIKLFNPGAELETLEMPPPVIPPEPLLRTCLERLKEDIENDPKGEGMYERLGAECAMLLKDVETCQAIADRCIDQQYPDLAGQLLCFIHRTRREEAMAKASS